ncbi:hypothetical protein [Undibacterium sp. Xuan67W]|uniref:hypothetical protein n=1 Tax=Undibacterium sp. Xuan67W TaxID=3413057 RepID=UPI003BF160A1
MRTHRLGAASKGFSCQQAHSACGFVLRIAEVTLLSTFDGIAYAGLSLCFRVKKIRDVMLFDKTVSHP